MNFAKKTFIVNKRKFIFKQFPGTNLNIFTNKKVMHWRLDTRNTLLKLYFNYMEI